jgi:penicillin-binding protein 1A
MPNAQGGRIAAPAWAQFMIEAYQRKPAPPDWPRPSSLVSRRVDERTGLLANPGCPSDDAYYEWFIPGTEPLAECTPRPAGPPPVPVPDTRPPRPPPGTVAPVRKP